MQQCLQTATDKSQPETISVYLMSRALYLAPCAILLFSCRVPLDLSTCTPLPRDLSDPVERTSSPQPLDLIRTQCMSTFDLSDRPIWLGDLEHHFIRLATSIEDCSHSDRLNLVVGGDFAIGRLVVEPERQDTLFLQVGFVDTGERAGYNHVAAVESGLQGGVFSGRTFSVWGQFGSVEGGRGDEEWKSGEGRRCWA